MSGGGIFSTFASGGEQFVGRDQGPPTPGSRPAARPTAGAPPGATPPLPQPAVEPDVAFSESDGTLTAQVTLPEGALQLQAE